jgi:hypothetical protein
MPATRCSANKAVLIMFNGQGYNMICWLGHRCELQAAFVQPERRSGGRRCLPRPGDEAGLFLPRGGPLCQRHRRRHHGPNLQCHVRLPDAVSRGPIRCSFKCCFNELRSKDTFATELNNLKCMYLNPCLDTPDNFI